jgi:hypothetical protein
MLYKRNMDPAELEAVAKKVNVAHKSYGIPIIFEEVTGDDPTSHEMHRAFGRKEVVKIPLQRLNGLVRSQLEGFYQSVSRLISLIRPTDPIFSKYKNMPGYRFCIDEFDEEVGEFKFSEEAQDFFTNPTYVKDVEVLQSLQRALTNLLNSKEAAELGFVYRERIRYNITRLGNPSAPAPEMGIMTRELLREKFVELLAKYLEVERTPLSTEQIKEIAEWMRDPDQIHNSGR